MLKLIAIAIAITHTKSELNSTFTVKFIHSYVFMLPLGIFYHNNKMVECQVAIICNYKRWRHLIASISYLFIDVQYITTTHIKYI